MFINWSKICTLYIDKRWKSMIVRSEIAGTGSPGASYSYQLSGPHKHRRFRNRCHRNPCAKGIYSYLYETSFILSNMHWVLLVICPSSRVVYILDSLMKRVQNPVDTYYLLKLLYMAFASETKLAYPRVS
ncbi:unnamed protein product [Lactuca virosa]|uniref:Ubiquitin-like protease family profile domain-containing protein n=1 Tax=Lactuca virosa TaxID=75947 RepID=A0AAU9LK99_9ASTR|nr:unnamed protein product [Lactuca virosa]